MQSTPSLYSHWKSLRVQALFKYSKQAKVKNLPMHLLHRGSTEFIICHTFWCEHNLSWNIWKRITATGVIMLDTVSNICCLGHLVFCCWTIHSEKEEATDMINLDHEQGWMAQIVGEIHQSFIITNCTSIICKTALGHARPSSSVAVK